MTWLGAGTDAPLIVIRAIHFAATALTAGTLMFRAVVAEPVLGSGPLASLPIGRQIAFLAWSGLGLTAVTGAIWLQLVAVSMSGLSFADAMTPDVLSTVLNETQFGQASELRFGLALVLGACLACDRPGLPRWLGLSAALGLMAAIAWTGHGGSTFGELGILHVTADALHLCAAAAWIGGLAPLILLLTAYRQKNDLRWDSLAQAAQRFSLLGIISVTTLLITGILNAWILVGSFHVLLITPYGRLLMVKAGVFALMLTIAAINRFWLTPQIAHSHQDTSKAFRLITRNSMFEIVLGFVIFAIVGALGTMHPAIHGL